MWPSLRDGDEALWAAPSGPPRVGQIVVARTAAGLVAHRVRRAGEVLLLQGDACPRADAPIPPEAVLGLVRRVRRGGRELGPEAFDRGPSRLGVLRTRLKAAVGRWRGRLSWR
jgi:hypothetical protein